MATSIKSKSALVTTAEQLNAGAAKHLGNGAQVTFLGSSYTATDLTTRLNQVVSAQSEVDAANAVAKTKLAARQNVMASARPLIRGFTAYIKAVYGNQPGVLADFGIHPKTPATPTAVAKAAAVVKRTSTRAARGTKGSKQIKAIKGDVTGITITPITATTTVVPATTGSATAGAPSPAPAASPALRTTTTAS